MQSIVDGKELMINAIVAMQRIIQSREKNVDDRILTNISKSGAACEHWYKFEIRSQLATLLKYKEVFCGVERERHDIFVSIADEPYLAAEIKILDNWYVYEGPLEGLKEDILKLEASQQIPHKFGILLCRFAAPAESKVKWMYDQLRSRRGFASESEFEKEIETLVRNNINNAWSRLPQICMSNDIFDELKLGGYLFEL